MKDRITITPVSLQKGTLDQLHVNHNGIEKTRLLAHESIYWININADIEYAISISPYVLIAGNKTRREDAVMYDTMQTIGLCSS